MASGFEVLGHSRALQMHWLRRIGAYVLDAFVVLLLTWALMFAFGETGPVLLTLASGVVFVLYGTMSEWLHGATLGKYAFGLEVRALHGRLTVGKAAWRNVPKFFWYIFPLLDVLLALLMQGDPRQRFSDRAANTTVVWRDAPPARATVGEPRTG